MNERMAMNDVTTGFASEVYDGIAYPRSKTATGIMSDAKNYLTNHTEVVVKDVLLTVNRNGTIWLFIRADCCRCHIDLCVKMERRQAGRDMRHGRPVHII